MTKLRSFTSLLALILLLSACIRPATVAPVSTHGASIATAVPPASTPTQAATPITEPAPASAATPNPQPIAKTFPSCEPDSRVAPFKVSEKLISPIVTPPADGLRALADRDGISIGAAVIAEFVEDPAFSKMLASNFNILVPEASMKWEYVHPEPDRYDFEKGDVIVSYARQQGMLMRGHVLVWEMQLPPWITEAEHTRVEWMQILCTHIKTVVGHYRGQIYAWDVVNEGVATNGTLYDSFWMQRIGPDYIAMAFQWAHEADPGARLFYNDNEGEGLNTKSQEIYALVRGLKQAGIPIDGVGLQMHVWLYASPSPEDLRANMQRLADLGLEVHITEMDVRIQNSRESDAIRLKAQAEVYRQIFETCLSAENCKAFLTWGVTDQYSWLRWYHGNPDAPLLFDDDGNPKPAYWAIQEVLADH